MLLSLDIGFRHMGWALFIHGWPIRVGCITTIKSARKHVRISDDNYSNACIVADKLNNIMEEFSPKGIVGELPSSGSQNSQAAHQMGIAMGIIGTLTTLWEVPTEWCTPLDLKLAVTGKKSGTKDEIMDIITKKYQYKKTEVGRGLLFETTSGSFTKEEFSHVADACGAYIALSNNNLVRIFG